VTPCLDTLPPFLLSPLAGGLATSLPCRSRGRSLFFFCPGVMFFWGDVRPPIEIYPFFLWGNDIRFLLFVVVPLAAARFLYIAPIVGRPSPFCLWPSPPFSLLETEQRRRVILPVSMAARTRSPSFFPLSFFFFSGSSYSSLSSPPPLVFFAFSSALTPRRESCSPSLPLSLFLGSGERPCLSRLPSRALFFFFSSCQIFSYHVHDRAFFPTFGRKEALPSFRAFMYIMIPQLHPFSFSLVGVFFFVFFFFCVAFMFHRDEKRPPPSPPESSIPPRLPQGRLSLQWSLMSARRNLSMAWFKAYSPPLGALRPSSDRF